MDRCRDSIYTNKFGCTFHVLRNKIRGAITVMKKALLTLLIFAGFAGAATPPCKIGADPVDPTYKWVPAVDWKLVKVAPNQETTMTTGSGKEATCILPAGQVIAYPPNGGNPVVVLCKNEITKGRPTGTEIPRESVTFNVTPPGQPTEMRIKVDGIPDSIDLDVSGTVNHNLTVNGRVDVVHSGKVALDLPNIPEKGKKKLQDSGGFCSSKKCKVGFTVLGFVGGGAAACAKWCKGGKRLGAQAGDPF